MSLKTILCIPVLNAESYLENLLSSIKLQFKQPNELIAIDSSSEDNTVAIFKAAGVQVHVIPRSEFNHGGTRQLAVEIANDADIIVFLTQDAIFAKKDSLENLLAYFKDEKVGAAYGRQLPCRGAGAIGAHARLFNYPAESLVKRMDDALRLGIKTAFISNSFAAYRRTVLMSVGGFPSDTIFGEDTYVAAKMLLAGWKVAYCAEAPVFHSHDYGLIQEFKRYFDIGVFHARESWIRQSFGQAEGEGLRYMRSELNYLRHNKPLLIPSAILRTLLKLVGYKVGVAEKYLPIWLKYNISMNRSYWRCEKGLE